MLLTAICDDNELHLKTIAKTFMDKCGSYSPRLMLFSSGEALLKEVENNAYSPEILLLDIVLAEDSGINIAKKINSLCPMCGIIYLTSYISYASDVYETRHSYFILKSQFEQRIASAVAKAVSDTSQRKNMTFKDHSTTFSLSAYKVAYLERSLKKTFVYLVSGRKYETYTKPDVLLREAGGSFFVQCHQSFYVNMYEVGSMCNDHFLLNNGVRIPISRSRKNEVKKLFYSFVSNSLNSHRL